MIFLRPWFLLLILIPFIFRLFRERIGAMTAWHKVIDPKLLPYLLVRGTNATAKQRFLFKLLLWTTLCIAMSGPAWDKTEVPAHTFQPGTIIVMELSPAMTGSNLNRAQQKIYDILTLLKGEQVGLVLYDRYGYTAGPLTFETDIIRNMVPHLKSSVLPERKSDPVAGFEQADKLFQNANIEQGRILFLTSGAYLNDDLEKIAQKLPHKIGVLGIGPAEPHPIPKESGGFLTQPDGKPLMVYLDPKKLSRLGTYQLMTPDDTDIQTLIDSTIPEEAEVERLTNQTLSVWRDRGGLLVVCTLPFFALMFRKGIIFLFLLFFMLPAQASLWLRPDQEDFRQQMIAVDFYKSQSYQRAESLFKKSPTLEALYNRGNALAYQNKIQEAINTYRAVLKKNPKHADALFNKIYLEKQLEKEKKDQQKSDQTQPEPPQKQQPQDQTQPEPPQKQQPQDQTQPEPPQEQPPQDQIQPEPPQKQQPQDQTQPEPPQEQPPQDQIQPEPPQNQDQSNPQKEQNPQAKRQQEQERAKEPLPSENEEDQQSAQDNVFDQESEMILNKLPIDEDSVLRYRIRQQYKRRMGLI